MRGDCFKGTKVKTDLARSRARKARRVEKVAENAGIAAAIGKEPLIASKQGLGRPRTRRKVLPRRMAFNRLEAACKTFVLLRAKHRGGVCEIGIVCGGNGPIEVWYHVTPQALGNALKYDARNILGSCHSCNGGEYFARKRGSPVYGSRHRTILGNEAVDWLQANAGRKQISTREALDMAIEYEKKIAAGEWRDGAVPM
jgi:hypothetical protein